MSVHSILSLAQSIVSYMEIFLHAMIPNFSFSSLGKGSFTLVYYIIDRFCSQCCNVLKWRTLFMCAFFILFLFSWQRIPNFVKGKITYDDCFVLVLKFSICRHRCMILKYSFKASNISIKTARLRSVTLIFYTTLLSWLWLDDSYLFQVSFLSWWFYLPTFFASWAN